MIDLIESSSADAYSWLQDICKELGTNDRHRALHALRGALHALRDRLSLEQNAHLAAQLPTLVRGIYFESWKPTHGGLPVRDLDDYLDRVAANIGEFDGTIDAFDLARAVYTVLGRRISEGEMHKIVAGLPHQLRSLWEPIAR
jgi:uncharacterized protein (DUF2267 family)